ncbi:hillarin-like [Palaemon carinicauda]|uniref:hillarin-like n=1 Tax=Palaemon carinicauda TaxID=392227 RepID=UPI0035B5D45E
MRHGAADDDRKKKLGGKNRFPDDKEVYCSSHVPKIGPGHLDGDAVGIRSALNVPKSANFVNDQIRPGGRPSIDGDALVLRSPYSRGNGSGNGSENGHNSSFSDYKYGRFDHTALHIAHALNATKIQRVYDKPIDQYLVSGSCNRMYKFFSLTRVLLRVYDYPLDHYLVSDYRA